MTEVTPHHYIPAFGKIYDAVSEYAEPILRIALGGILIPHGLQKLFGAFGGMGFAGNAALFDRLGFTPGIFWGTLVGCTELIGGILLVLGLFTRFAAAAAGRPCPDRLALSRELRGHRGEALEYRRLCRLLEKSGRAGARVLVLDWRTD